METTKKPKKAWYKRIWVWIIILIVIIIGASSGSSDDTPKVSGDDKTDSAQQKTEEKTVFKPGDVIEFDGKKVTVTDVERNWNSGNQFITPGSGNEFVKVQVAIENNSKSQASYNTFDWKLQDSNGVIKDVASVVFTVDGALNSGDLAHGGKVAGFLVFEVPADDAGLTLSYNPSFWTNKKIEIKL